MKPAASAAPQGGCVDSQLDAALAILRNEGRLREQPTFTLNLRIHFATSCCWYAAHKDCQISSQFDVFLVCKFTYNLILTYIQ